MNIPVQQPVLTGVNLVMEEIIKAALREDLAQGDVTTDNIKALACQTSQVVIRTRQDCVVSGIETAQQVFALIDKTLCFCPVVSEGQMVPAGTTLVELSGQTAALLKGERTALNFLQHLSGIATETQRYVAAVAGTGCRIAHTRKTTPGLRLLEQQAVIHGGGVPHRFHLGSAVMLKDNHLEALGDTTLAEAIRQIRQQIPHTMTIEVEADTLEKAYEAAEAGADIILLDNMPPSQIREAVERIGKAVTLEASGGIALETIRAYAETGVQVISTSKITLGAPAVDIGLDFL